MGQGVAVKFRAGLAVAAISVALLPGCGSEKSEGSPLGQAVGAVAKSTIGMVTARSKGTVVAAPAPVTRADLEKFGLPILRARVAARGADAFVTMADTKGNVVTWATTDGSTFTLRDGVLIQTRGLGPDLMSAQAPSLADLQADGGTHRRIYYFLGEDDQPTRRTYDCTVFITGGETIEVFSRAHRVKRVTETCVRPQGAITNEFWIEGAAIRKSRQLASGGVGFIEFERVID